MNPKPLSAISFLIVPCGIQPLLRRKKTEKRTHAARSSPRAPPRQGRSRLNDRGRRSTAIGDRNRQRGSPVQKSQADQNESTWHEQGLTSLLTAITVSIAGMADDGKGTRTGKVAATCGSGGVRSGGSTRFDRGGAFNFPWDRLEQGNLPPTLGALAAVFSPFLAVRQLSDCHRSKEFTSEMGQIPLRTARSAQSDMDIAPVAK